MSKKLTIESIKDRILKNYDTDYTLIDEEYINNKTKMKVRHNICGEVFLTRMDSFLSNGRQCMKCFGNKKLNIKDIRIKCFQIHGVDYEVISDSFDNNKSHIKVKHRICSNTYDIIIHSLLNLKTKCAYCNGNKKQSLENIKERCKRLHGEEYTILSDEIKNIDYKMSIKHSCGYIWNVKITNFINKKSGCPMCAPKSKGEIIIRNFLESNKINFIIQKTFDDCKSIGKLYFDFYLKDYNLCIEFDGEQHFKSVSLFGGEKSLKSQIERDNIKNNYCYENKIKLIRIPYWNFNRIEDILRLELLIK